MGVSPLIAICVLIFRHEKTGVMIDYNHIENLFDRGVGVIEDKKSKRKGTLPPQSYAFSMRLFHHTLFFFFLFFSNSHFQFLRALVQFL